jgi:hypothetical protein
MAGTTDRSSAQQIAPCCRTEHQMATSMSPRPVVEHGLGQAGSNAGSAPVDGDDR